MSQSSDTEAAVRIAVERMAQAAMDWLAALTPAQRRKAALPFDDEERRRWYYTPTERAGLPLVEMDPIQRQRARRLLAAGLSRPGYATAAAIMALEYLLDQEEGWRTDYPGRTVPTARRDPELYFFAVFGEPGGQAPWGWRVGGHHVALHYTIVEGQVVAPVPCFFGAHPAEAPLVGPGRLRPLAGEEDLARELVHALSEEQRATAVLAPAAPPDLVQANRPQVEDGALPRSLTEIFSVPLPAEQAARTRVTEARFAERLGLRPEHLEALRYTRTPKGLPAARMSAAQRELLTALIRQYVDRLPEEVAAYHAARLTGPALDAVHFAWAGGLQPRQPHYYRVQGPRLLIEYDNTQDDVNHIHAVWRDPEGDFGADLLAQHYARAH